VLVMAGVYFYFSSGHVPVATNSPEMPLERKFAAAALHAYLDQQPHPNPQVAADEPNFLAGAKVYKTSAPFATVCPASRRRWLPTACS